MTALSVDSYEADRVKVDAAAAPVTNTQIVRLACYVVQGLLDLGAISTGFALANYMRHGSVSATPDFSSLSVILPVFAVMSFYAGAYSYSAMLSLRLAAGRVLTSLFVTLAIALLTHFATKDAAELSRVVFFLGAGLSALSLIAVQIPMRWIVHNVLGQRFMRRLLIVDGSPFAAPSAFHLVDAEREGIVPDVHDPMMLNKFSYLVRYADRVVVSCPPDRRENWAIYLKGVGCWGELLVPELHGVAPIQDEPSLGLAGIRVSIGPLDIRNRVLKRILDLLIAVPAIVALTPVLVLIAIAIKAESRGPILFRQRRMGRGNRLFDVYKFRSMQHSESDPDGKVSASRNDNRITRVGRFIRATSIDEIPQLFNVLEGDMSLVGPRPHALGSLAGDQLFWQVDQRYWLRHAIKPGITGLAQVRGFRGATDHEDDLNNRLQSDLEYVANWSIVSDLSILVRTLMVVKHKNAF